MASQQKYFLSLAILIYGDTNYIIEVARQS